MLIQLYSTKSNKILFPIDLNFNLLKKSTKNLILPKFFTKYFPTTKYKALAVAQLK